MSQNRRPPAYQEYAAAMLSAISFRTMTLQDRGLLYTMRLECWVNYKLPGNFEDLAKVLGLQPQEVTNSLPAVMPLFELVNGFIISPELEDYREHLKNRSEKLSKAGKLGSAITNRKHKQAITATNDSVSTTLPISSRPPRRGGRDSSVQSNTTQKSQNQPSGNELLDDPFVTEYDAAENYTSNEYVALSRGE